MALKDFMALADDKLHDIFSKKPHDSAKARAAMLKRLDKTHEQFTATEPVKGRKMFRIQNGIVEFTLPFEVSGKSAWLIPSERFADAITHLKDSITKGELDDALKGDGVTNAPASANKTPRKPRGALSTEALEARRQKMKANGTAKVK